MERKRLKTIVFLAAMAAILATFVLLSIFDQPPRMPADTDHPRHSIESSCVQCHHPAGSKPLNPHHTERRSCLKCHKAP
ncbi:MAG: hypothetical protein HY897_12200 [Deltaproteobacteria bacterium]|nr:hypothetical protein [Deltaproteobacteria bacterium]